jgi:CRISPR-associated protein Cas1
VLFPVMLARIVAAGLDPFAGFLHEIRGRKPALALDLMDEWRALAVDVPVLRLFLEGGLSRSDFRRDGEAVLLRDAEAVAIPVLSVLSRVRGGLLEAIDRRLTEFRNAVRKLSEPEPLEIKSDDVGGVWEVVQV